MYRCRRLEPSKGYRRFTGNNWTVNITLSSNKKKNNFWWLPIVIKHNQTKKSHNDQKTKQNNHIVSSLFPENHCNGLYFTKAPLHFVLKCILGDQLTALLTFSIMCLRSVKLTTCVQISLLPPSLALEGQRNPRTVITSVLSPNRHQICLAQTKQNTKKHFYN